MSAAQNLIDLTAEGEDQAGIRILLDCTARALSPVSGRPETLVGTDADWSAVASLAIDHGVSSLVYEAIRTSPGLLAACPVAVATRLGAVSIAAGLSVEAHLRDLSDLKQVLDREGIRALTVKGLTLGVLAYSSPRLRPSGDIDLLVPREQFCAAVDEIMGLGYRPVRPDSVLGYVDLSRNQIEEHIETKTGVTFIGKKTPVDLHWTLDDFDDPLLRPWFPFSSGFDATRLFDSAVMVRFDELQVATLPLEDLLGYLCFHGAKHRWSRLIWVADIAALVRSRDLNWDTVMSRSVRNDAARILRVGLLLASGILGAQLPADVDRFLRHDRLARSAARLAARGMFNGFTSGQLHMFRLLTFQGTRPKAIYLFRLVEKRLG